MAIASFGYEDLIRWSGRLHPWQRDALRRILAVGELTEADVEELAGLAKAPHEGDEKSIRRAKPATLDHVRPRAEGLPAICVLRVRDISRVNALAPGPVEFAAEGLTVVYGDNASGKSGVVRILKRACRALDRGGPIRPSIYEPEEGSPPRAIVDYRVAGMEKSAPWIEGGDAGEDLATVNVFDSGCARSQVERANPISYRPAILQVFKDLAAASERVRGKLEEAKRALGSRDGALEVLEDELGTDTEAGRFVQGLSELSDTATLERLAALSEEERVELESLRTALRENPLDRAEGEAARVRRIEGLRLLVETAAGVLSDEASDAFERQLDRARATEEAAQAAGEAFESGVPLEGLRSGAWKALWEAARRFSEAEAYRGAVYPVVRDGALCVLCQQPLDAEAKSRLRSFEAYIKSDVQQQAEKARHEADTTREHIAALALPGSRVALGDTGLRREGVGEDIRRFLILARARRRFLLRKVSGRAVGARPLLPAVPAVAAVGSSVAAGETRLRAAAVNATRREMIRRHRELEDREMLAPRRDAIAREVKRLGAVSILDRAIRDTDSHGITRKEGEAAEAILSGRLRSEFAENLQAMGFHATAVDVELGGGRQGERPYKVSLIARSDIPAAEVLSEGERTCVALAGFLGELATTGNSSAVILDDPVSSLDHRYRDRVAERLAMESRGRQVVVFTHDIVFLWMLRRHCEGHGVALQVMTLERGHREHGRATRGAPWVARNVSERLGWLRNALQEAEAVLRREDRGEYEQKARIIYKRLRESWERAVEELLLNKVVQRFLPDVQTRRLKEIADITEKDVRLVEREMSRCSAFEHDEPGAMNQGIPEPETIRGDLGTLEAWVEALRKRGRKN